MRGNSVASRDVLREYAATYAASRELRLAKAEAAAAQLDAEEARASKAAFLSGLNHELRTPLNHITGFAGLLRQADDLSAEKRDEYLDTILSSASELLKLIDAILDAAAGADQHRPGSSVPVSDPIPILRRLLYEHNQTLFVGKVDIADNLPPTDVSSQRLFQALQRIFIALSMKSEERRSIGLSVKAGGGSLQDVSIAFHLLADQEAPTIDIMRSVKADVTRLGLQLEDNSFGKDRAFALIVPGQNQEQAA